MAIRLRITSTILALACIGTGAAVNAQSIDAGTRTVQEREAQQKLDAVRDQIRQLTAQQRAATDRRSETVSTLRDKELALAAVAKDVHALDATLATQQARLDDLKAQRAKLEAALAGQRAALAALLRSAYALGRSEELKLLLRQDDVAAIARVLAYNRYFQRDQIVRIDRLRADLKQLADLQAAIAGATRDVETTRAARSAEGVRLETERAERERLVAQIDATLLDQGSRIAELGKNETALNELLERLRDVFADIPQQLGANRSFASLRGALRWPLRGKVVTGFGARDESGRTSSGLLIAAKSGSAVHAVSHGRVAFADWLRGYGLMIIVDHGDGYLSLYGCNETLLAEVGDWVDADATIATSGASGGQKVAGLYFELRAKGKAVDPRGWLR